MMISLIKALLITYYIRISINDKKYKKCIVFSIISYYFFNKTSTALATHKECFIYTTHVCFNMILSFHPNNLSGIVILNVPRNAHKNDIWNLW